MVLFDVDLKEIFGFFRLCFEVIPFQFTQLLLFLAAAEFFFYLQRTFKE